MRVHAQSCLILCDPMDYSPPGFSVHGIFQSGILSGVRFPPPRDLPDPGIKPESPMSPALQADSLVLEPLGKPLFCVYCFYSLDVQAPRDPLCPRAVLFCSCLTFPRREGQEMMMGWGGWRRRDQAAWVLTTHTEKEVCRTSSGSGSKIKSWAEFEGPLNFSGGDVK